MNRRRTKPVPPPPPKRKYPFYRWLQGRMPTLGNLFGDDRRSDLIMPVRYFYYFLWVVFLLVLYEGLGYKSEQYVRRSIQLKKEVEDLRAEYTTIKAEYMKSGKQSEIADRVKKMGLEENLTPPKKIVSPSSER